MLQAIIQKIKSAPKNPGVYIFYKKNSPLYIGKASNLRNRLKNYLSVIDFKTEALHREADELKLLLLHSNIEALIVESQLIKKLKPRYNVLWQDDKNYFYVAISKEKFPRIFITHQPKQIRNSNIEIRNKSKIQNSNEQKVLNLKNLDLNIVSDFGFRASDLAEYIGPFTDGNALKSILRLLRRTYPYCTCKPHLRICLNAQINNCFGYCCNKNANPSRKEIALYKRSISKIENILTGKDKKFIKTLKDPYELLILEKIWAHEPYLEQSPNSKHQARNKPKTQNSNEQKFLNLKNLDLNIVSDFGFRASDLSKIECYDNSHLSGKEAVGAMTAWIKEQGTWGADKNMWRKFKIRGHYTEDDPRMMEEIVSRRLHHPEWPYPDLMIIDGGITQFKAAERALNKFQITNSKLKIKVISFAKPEQKVYGWKSYPVSIAELPDELQKLIPMAIQNTHNFVIRYHRTLRRRGIIQA